MKSLLFLLALLSLGKLAGQETAELPGPAKVVTQHIDSDYMKGGVDYHVYFPDAYELDSTLSYPVIYWLHGSGGWPPGVLNMLAERFHAAMQGEKIPPALVVFLDDGKRESMWVDSKDGSVRMESVIIHELIPHIDTSFRTIGQARGRMLEGGSMGGYGAARLGLKYPELFTAISLINPGPMQEMLDPEEAPVAGKAKAQQTLDRVYGGDTAFFRQLSPWQIAIDNAPNIRGNLEIRMILGGADPSLTNVLKFSDHLDQLDIEHSTTILEGAGHSPKEMFAALGNSYWEFFKQNLPTPEQ
ncbi:esterase/lipase superfamily enzyme [Lewinella marina]|uniref:Esterase n=1 Tax=Neolewinella marina TaxID=438751 RepID=A0A2G0CBQ2_9BACT|nr:alpha/beta hydrolase-fold protein [Neolewinella marina]NJB87083.1 esterase/lipase superfamily enzyme [Neolewinella marina]PHK97386.1 esterase [Neolewinella marina]